MKKFNGSGASNEVSRLSGTSSGYVRRARLHDGRSFRITLKQWRALHAVVDYGGFCDAAESLHLSQSSISYAIAKLQEQLGVVMLKIHGRKAQLTEEGKILLERSRTLLRDAMELEIVAENLRNGSNTEVRVVIDHDFPADILTRSLQQLSAQGCKVRVALAEMSASRINDALHARRADLAITSVVPEGFDGVRLMCVEYAPVAHRSHPLAKQNRKLGNGDLQHEVEVVLSTAIESHAGVAFLPSVESQRWSLASLDNAIKTLLSGMGYAWLPLNQIQRWIDSGDLVILTIQDALPRHKPLHVAYSELGANSAYVNMLVDVLLQQACPPPLARLASGLQTP